VGRPRRSDEASLDKGERGQRSSVADWALLLVCNLIWASQVRAGEDRAGTDGAVFATFFPMMLATLLLVPIVGRERRGRTPRRAARTAGLAPARSAPRRVRVHPDRGFRPGGRTTVRHLGGAAVVASNAALLMLALPVSTAVMAYFFLASA